MRYDSGHKERTRERILDEAGRAIRVEGPQQVGVSGLMSRAGLTHGGFYAHFPSKDQLVAEAIYRVSDEMNQIITAAIDGLSAPDALKKFINYYLSTAHAQNRERGCPLPALAADLPRLTSDAKAAYGAGLMRMTAMVAQFLDVMKRPDPQMQAASVMAELVGAVGLSRAVGDEAQARAILDYSRRSVLTRLGLSLD